ncbi:MAG: hypothetical protein KDD47_08485 [Acidobacteria bacterium]|nr:hypothetical protein [Acidobacteriota bacterium]
MAIEYLPESVQTLYSELLDQTIQTEAEAVANRLPAPGSFVSKEVRGSTYWYLQRLEGQRKRQYFLGPDSPELQRWMAQKKSLAETMQPDAERRAELVSMLRAGGAARLPAAVGRVLRLLTEIGVFRLGGVLVGTQAFVAYGNMLGVRFQGSNLRTQDLDIAQDRGIAVALDPLAVPAALEEALREADSRFFAVPALDPRSPSTAFKVRGRDLRVDLLTPARGVETRPVALPYLKAAAQPLPHLGYLIDRPEQAVLCEASGLLVKVPQPARFVWHKLWASTQRPATDAAKSAKDRRQALELAEVLHADRPRDLEASWEALPGSLRSRIPTSLERLEEPTAQHLLGIARGP